MRNLKYIIDQSDIEEVTDGEGKNFDKLRLLADLFDEGTDIFELLTDCAERIEESESLDEEIESLKKEINEIGSSEEEICENIRVRVDIRGESIESAVTDICRDNGVFLKSYLNPEVAA